MIRAIHQWCSDQGFTPYLSVAVDHSTRVPNEFVRDGNIVLNVGLEATSHLDLGNQGISFQARFGGRVFPVMVPIARVQAIYARENGQGMAFEVTEVTGDAESEVAENSKLNASSAPKGLRSVSKSDATVDGSTETGTAAPSRSHLTRIK